MLQFKTNELKSRKAVDIDGVIFTVRRMGNLEQLDYMQGLRKLQKLGELEIKQRLTEKQSNEAIAISDSVLTIAYKLFDDGGDQSNTKRIIGSLPNEEIAEIIEQIFSEDTNETTDSQS
jgi:hypothetical protein